MQQNNISQKALTDFLSINKVAFSEWKSGKSNSGSREKATHT